MTSTTPWRYSELRMRCILMGRQMYSPHLVCLSGNSILLNVHYFLDVTMKRSREAISQEKKKRFVNTSQIMKIYQKLTSPLILAYRGRQWETFLIIQESIQVEALQNARRQDISEMAEALLQWFIQKRSQNIIITDELLKGKARQLGNKMGEFSLINYYVDYF